MRDRRTWPRTALLAGTLLASGCVLDREGRLGGCPEGPLVCVVTSKDYAFNSERNKYDFSGRCEIKRDDGGSEFGDPLVTFHVRGAYDRKSFEFAEAADFSGQIDSSASLIGSSTKDPWIYPHHPVAIKNYAGDPDGLAHAFCVDGIPPKYSRLPFTRNVILYMMSDFERLSMAKAASDAKDAPPPPPPPAPPCPQSHVVAPPRMDMPTEDLVYAEQVEGITVYLASQCGGPQVDYQHSRFQVVFEHFDDGWKAFRDFQVPLSYAAPSGSISSQTLPLGKTGHWRVKARQLVVQAHASAPTIGDYGPWVHFRIGPPVYELSQLHRGDFTRVTNDAARNTQMQRRFGFDRSPGGVLAPLDTRRAAPVENTGRSLIRQSVD